MASKGKESRKDKKDTRKSEKESYLSKDTHYAILAISSLVFSLLLLASAFDWSGPVGKGLFNGLSSLFGLGYYLAPLAFFILSISFFRSKKESFAVPQIFGSALFFFSSLGLIDTLMPNRGGLVGSFISIPLLKLFAIYITILILVALLVISFLVTFDKAIKIDFLKFLNFFGNLFGSKKEAPQVDELVAKAEEKIQAFHPIPMPEPVKDIRPKKVEDEDSFAMAMAMHRGHPWNPPPLSLLERDRGKPGVGDIKANANIIKRTLQNFGIIVEMDEISIGPSVTRYALKPAEGVKLQRILALQPNLELALAAHPVRIEAPIPGKSLVGIEVPNSAKTTIGLGSLLTDSAYAESGKSLLVALGRDVAGETRFADVGKMPHILVAGATGSGKSVTIHAIITSLLFRNPPENLKFIMIDPKRVELTLYNKIPHLLTPVITEGKKAILALKWATKEMERRYDVLEKQSVRDIDSYHKNASKEQLEKESMPFIIVIIDELADLMQMYPRELESAIVRLAQMSRAVGIHLILSTQRPSVNVITGLIKANIPSRIALQVSSQIDSRTILDTAGAEKLLGAGDMLYLAGDRGKPERIQSAFITEGEVKRVVKHLTDEYADELNSEINLTNENVSNAIFSATLEESDPGDDDELYEEARTVVVAAGKASTSYLQRKLRIGYARAARLIDILEERGVIGPGSGAKPREVIGVSTSGNAEGFGEDDNTEI